MVLKLPESTEIKARLRRVLRPKTKLGRTTLWFGALALILEGLRLIFRAPNGTMLSGWATFLIFIFAVCAVLMLLRWVRQQLMWRLRNRLIVTYVFIGVIPVILLVAMGLLAGYLFAGQFATYVAMSDLQSELHHLEATNKSLATQFLGLAKAGNLNEQLAAEIASASDENFRHRSVTVWDGDKGFVLSEPGRGAVRTTDQGLSRHERRFCRIRSRREPRPTSRGEDGELRDPSANCDFQRAGHPGTSSPGCVRVGIGDSASRLTRSRVRQALLRVPRANSALPTKTASPPSSVVRR